MTCKWFGPILLVLIGGAFCTEGKNLVGPKKTVEIVQNKNDKFYYNQTATMRERRHTNLILHVLENAGIDPDAGELRLTPGAECARVCHDNESPMICKFEFILEHYHTMGPACKDCSQGVTADCFAKNCISADGIEKGVLSVNRQIPGPAVQVCKRDIVIVDVLNEMSGVGETIHWHGVLQHGTPWMDGVPMLTQCPIQSPNMFRYAFVAREPGTKFYHSHAGHNKINGIYGPMIVRESEQSDPNSLQYECDLEEHTIMLADWLHAPAEMYVPGLQSTGNLPDSILLNGRGQYRNSAKNITTKAPLAVFRMHGCRSYRFRIVNACNGVCAIQLQIEKHPMTIIASDSAKVRPTVVNTLYSLAGERYDFVVHANQRPGNYWIRAKPIGFCEGKVAEQFAILSYADPAVVSDHELSMPSRSFPLPQNPYPLGTHLNKPNTVCGQRKDFCVSDLIDAGRTTVSKVDLMTSKPDYQFVLPFNNYRMSEVQIYSREFYHHFMNFGLGRSTIVGAVDNITFAFPSFPPLTQPEDITESDDDVGGGTWCDENNLPDRCAGYLQCPCAHRLAVEKNKIVELILFDDTKQPIMLTHPFHLHGHDFHVLDMVPLSPRIPMTAEYITEVVQNGRFDEVFGQHRKGGRSILNAPSKDTVQIPSSGLVRLRFNSTNPGFWLMHCHIDWHFSVGMGFVFQVGDTDEMAPTPDNFPTCYDYAPDIGLEATY